MNAQIGSKGVSIAVKQYNFINVSLLKKKFKWNSKVNFTSWLSETAALSSNFDKTSMIVDLYNMDCHQYHTDYLIAIWK